MSGQRRRHTPEQIIRKLREGERLLGEGRQLIEVRKHLGHFYREMEVFSGHPRANG